MLIKLNKIVKIHEKTFGKGLSGHTVTMLGLPTVKISAQSVTLIEQGSAGSGRGLGAMPLKYLSNR